MTIPEFLNHIKHPETLLPEDTAILKGLVDRFPYCTSTQVLLAFRLLKENDLDFPIQLKKVAAYASSRKKLKQLFEQFQYFNGKNAESLAIMDSPVQISPLPEKNPEFVHPIPKPPSAGREHEEELLAIVRQRLAEIKLEREKQALDETRETDRVPKQPFSVLRKKLLKATWMMMRS